MRAEGDGPAVELSVRRDDELAKGAKHRITVTEALTGTDAAIIVTAEWPE